MRIRILSAAAVVLMLSGVGIAQRVSERRHPNLAAAQRLVEQANARITAAQHANEWDMAGHAAKAKQLLDQAYGELKIAAEAANKH